MLNQYRFQLEDYNVFSIHTENNKEHIVNVSLRFFEDNSTKKYLGNKSMWLAGVKEYRVPNLIGDIVFILKNKLIGILDSDNVSKDILISFANHIKNQFIKNPIT